MRLKKNKKGANMRKKELASELTNHFFKPTLQEEAKLKRWQKWLIFLVSTSLFVLYLATLWLFLFHFWSWYL